MNLKEYQKCCHTLFKGMFDINAESEWRTIMGKEMYSPIPDIAIGPFSYNDGERLSDTYQEMYIAHIGFIRNCVQFHLTNVEEMSDDFSEERNINRLNEKVDQILYFNFNPRCFIAIEIEDKVTRKHLMG